VSLISSYPFRIDMETWRFPTLRLLHQIRSSDTEVILEGDPYGSASLPPGWEFYKLTLYGTGFQSFDSNGVPQAGVVTGAQIVALNNAGVIVLGGLSIPVGQFVATIGANDPAQLNALLLAGDDDIQGGLEGRDPFGAVVGDLLRGDGGNDTISGDGGPDTIFGGSGDDVVDGGAGDDRLLGEAGDDRLSDPSGRNYLHSGDGNDVIFGGADFDDSHGNIGNDTVHGGGSDDWVVGGQGNDMLFGDDGGDLCYGQLGSDTINAGAGDDAVVGGQANDVLDGGAGNDYVTGDRGDDTVTGGLGADTFHTNNVQGIDRVTDFSQTQGDKVLVDVGSTYTLSQVGADTLIDMGGGNQMVLVGVQLASLTNGWISGG
jgi:Ca2+-binding RTX toxin-like protein